MLQCSSKPLEGKVKGHMENDRPVEKTEVAKELSIGLGSQLFIQIQGTSSRLKSILVGALPGRYLILTAPRTPGVESYIYEGNTVTITFLSEGVVYGFRANILNHIFVPARLVFLSYPEKIEKHELRRHYRVECNIPAEISLEGHDAVYRGVILDISTGGCKFTFLEPENLNEHPIQVGDRLNTTFELMGIRNIRTISGEIRSLSMDDKKVTLGISFDQTNTELLNKIESYVNSVIKFL